MKIISKFERYFFAQKESHFERIISRKKALETFIISKRESIFIDFVLLIIRKRESSLNLMYYENMYFRGLLGACFVLLRMILIYYQYLPYKGRLEIHKRSLATKPGFIDEKKQSRNPIFYPILQTAI